jgi:hypothetical protein
MAVILCGHRVIIERPFGGGPSAAVAAMPIGAATLGFLHHRATLDKSFAAIAGAALDIPPPPHLYLPEYGHYARRQLREPLRRLSLDSVRKRLGGRKV